MEGTLSAGVSVCRNAEYDISQAQSRYFEKKGPPNRESLPTRFFSRNCSEMKTEMMLLELL